MSYFASSASPELAHWHEELPTHLMSVDVIGNVAQATNDALYAIEEVVKEIAVTTEHKMEDICKELGIHPFHHNFFGNLVGTTLVLYKVGEDHRLEIRREGTKHSTSFPVQLAA